MVDDDDVAGEAVGFLEVLRGEQDCRAVTHQFLDDAPQILAALCVEAGRRLVEEEDGRAGDERGRQVEPAPHAARVGLEDAVTRVGQAEGREELVGPPRRDPAVQVGEPPDHVDVLAPGEVLVDGGVLARQPDQAADHVGLLHHVVPEDAGAPRVGFEDGGEDAHGRRLAGTVGAEQAEHGAGLDGERDLVERPHAALGEDLHQVVGLDGKRSGGRQRKSH